MSRGPAITVARFAEHVAARLAAHEACTDSRTRASNRAKLRDTARKLGVSAPTWATQREVASAAAQRDQRRKRPGRPLRRAASSDGPALVVVPAGVPMRALELPDALRTWRARTVGACVGIDRHGRVTLDEPAARRTFDSVDAAVAAVEAA